MRIQSITVNNFKAFLGKYSIKVDGKNLFIYGENGSGKSSLYYALKDFFQSSLESIRIDELENIFVDSTKRGNTSIKVTFKPNSHGGMAPQVWTWVSTNNDARDLADTAIRDGNKLKSFLTYKHLLAIHHLKKDERINLFDLLVNGVLKHFTSPLTGGKELGELWNDNHEIVSRPISRTYNSTKKAADTRAALKIFNDAFGNLFDPTSPDYILTNATPILEKFNHNIELSMSYSHAWPNGTYTEIEGAEVGVDLKYAGKAVDKPHLFLNEARLSAIAISIYLGMIKRHPQGLPCKILFLDDIFIGLDIANRLPLLEILKSEFPEYQIFVTTYDKPWFEYASSFLANRADWKTVEFYAQEKPGGYEKPVIFYDKEFLGRAKYHYNKCDYKSAAVYTRAAFEKTIRNYCNKKNKMFAYSQKGPDANKLWSSVCRDIDNATKVKIETYRNLVLNPFSHYDITRHEVKSELRQAMAVVRKLEKELAELLSTP